LYYITKYRQLHWTKFDFAQKKKRALTLFLDSNMKCHKTRHPTVAFWRVSIEAIA